MRALVIIMLAVAPAAAEPAVRHVPPAAGEAGKQVELVAEAPPTTPTLVAHVRLHGSGTFQAIDLVRKDDAHWVAVVPAATVAVPGIDYYLDAGGQPVFASAEWPHTMDVRASPQAERRTRDSIRAEGRRSKVETMGEWVEFGTKAQGVPDHYYRVDADFSYRLWTYPLEEIRVGYTRLLGDTLQSPDKMCPSSDACSTKAGFKVAGWFELGTAVIEGLRLDGRMSVLATQDGFGVGGRGELRVGAREGNHVAAGVEYLATVGTNGFFRLGWGTVPHTPMSATVEITNLPASYRDTGVRLYYDLGFEVYPGVRLNGRIGYAARTQSVAGFTAGGGAAVEF